MHCFNKYIVNIKYSLIFVPQLTAKQMTTQELEIKMADFRSKGSKISDDALKALILRQEKNSTKNMSRAAKGFERRAEVVTTGNMIVNGVAYYTMSEYNAACNKRLMSTK